MQANDEQSPNCHSHSYNLLSLLLSLLHAYRTLIVLAHSASPLSSPQEGEPGLEVGVAVALNDAATVFTIRDRVLQDPKLLREAIRVSRRVAVINRV